MTEMEQWVDVKGYEGYYQISSYGRVRSVERVVVAKQERYKKPVRRRMSSRLLKLHPDGKGYPIVRPCLLGKGQTLNVHRLVAIHFIPNPDGKPAVNHIDADPFNNHVSNLEWCTIAENNRHTIAIGRRLYNKKHTKVPSQKTLGQMTPTN